MEASVFSTYYNSPIGWIQLTGTAQGIETMLFVEAAGAETSSLPACAVAGLAQLAEYFNGERQQFDLPLAPHGTAFQQQVWQELQKIPFGKTFSYLQVARAIGGEKAIRAVGAANGRNPLCLVVPCHRVIGSNGSLTGYAGGLWRKEWLLRHEGVLKPEQQLALF
ncbi:methylated-DNA--[protein]-cysteine S-methyltransferase [Pontibacter qinzhouensis]|uniref:Methylated-DNA--protein-cysteine methyltransferase n=1 Tax=Pontibacter qinzhouensis TaxID=2603253 RepID=A0A5C8JLX7_9BACT|nr:methylated-DNA--[protein]-cysteine S-methyltransferase [Pontibacter qinzhouensis]TXK37657.1 methylated-DNA--[protein]-cysteine S-methyltransferase [Pontibacter qinzhouensis]